MNVGLAPPGQATYVNLLIIDPQRPGTIYAACIGRGGLFKTTDGGATWSTINSGLPLNAGFPPRITALAMDSEDTSVLYAGTSVVGSSVIFRTQDGGLTWTAFSADFGSVAQTCCSWISALAVDPRKPGAVYAALSTTSSGGAIWRTMDSGAIWQNVFASSSANVTALGIDPQYSSRIYAGSTDGVIESDDAGVRWRQIPGSPTLISFLGLDGQHPGTLYAAGADGLFAIEAGRQVVRQKR